MVWQIYARTPNAEEEYAAECYKAGIIAVGWSEVGDLRGYDSCEELKEGLRKLWHEHYEEWPKTLVADAGNLWRFRSEVHIGDLVICPDARSSCLYVGQIASDYFYARRKDRCRFKHRRKVKWLGEISKSQAQQIWRKGRPIQTVARLRSGEGSLRRLLSLTPGKGTRAHH